MDNISHFIITEAERERYIDALTPELVLLRTKAGISQEELADLIGISRQTYGTIERQTRRMSWSTFLSLLFFYFSNQKTRTMIESIDALPTQISQKFNAGNKVNEFDINEILGKGGDKITEKLDEQALHSIKSLVLIEYARCTKTPGDIVIRSFDGMDFSIAEYDNTAIDRALDAIKDKQDSYEK